ncbi:MAG: cobalamin [Bryobacterales bacterium]|nr:cobalamin [Bryobacterales bacterium]
MHIPDGYLSTPVWVATDVVAAPTVFWLARRAQSKFDHHRVPLMGVMGAFVFAAQMLNFPAGNGTSSHLVGGALLGCLMGPAAASIVMTAILATQALLFQDGGLLALGANVFNMAIAGVFAGYLPFALLKGSRTGLFLAGFCSLMTAALLALSELLVSGVAMPPAMITVSLAWFAVSALIEGALTMAVATALERIQPGCLRRPQSGSRAWVVVAAAATLLASFGWLLASAKPDGLQSLALRAGLTGRVSSLLSSPLGEYQASFIANPALSRTVAGMAGLVVIYVLCTAVSRAWAATRREGA